MTTMAVTESFDAPMMDFSGEDIPMQTSSSLSWIHPEAAMDDDDSNFNLGDVEIDMENYHPDTFEYEMTDDPSAQQPIEVHDVEVIDVSQAHTPAIIDTVVEDATTGSPAVPEHDLTDTHDHPSLDTPPTLVVQVPSPIPQPAQDGNYPEIARPELAEQREWEQGHSELGDASPSPRLADDQQLQDAEEPPSPEAAGGPTPTWDVTATAGQQTHLRQLTPTPREQPEPESTHEELTGDPIDNLGEDENRVPSRASSGDPHEVSDGIFIDPPPPVLLSLGDLEEEYHLFNHPTRRSPTAGNEAGTDDVLFLHDFPTLYYEPLAKVFQALRSDDRLAQIFDLSRGELVIDAYDLVDLIISEDNLYSIEVSFHDLNLLHDHADLAGPLRIRVGCNPRRFITRYRELKSQLEQFNLVDEATADDAQVQDQGCLAEQPDANDASGYLGQGGEGDENQAPEGLGQETTEQPADGAGSDAHTVGRFDGGESSDEAEPEQARPAGDEESDAGQLFDDEHTEQLVGVAENDPEQRTAAVIADGGHPSSAEDLGAADVHEYSDLRDVPLLGDNSAESEEFVATNEDYEADFNQNDQESEPGETPTIEGGARGGDWETTASDAQQVQDDRHDDGSDVVGTEKYSDITELIAPRLDDDPAATQQDTDTDSIGQQTLDEFTDAQEEPRDDHLPREEGEDPNSNTDQSNEQIPDLEQYVDGFNWDEEFSGDFDDGEFDGFADQSNVEGRLGSQEPTSGRNSKRGFDEVDSDTADEEGVLGDISPNSKRKKVL